MVLELSLHSMCNEKADFGVYVAKNIALFFKKLHYHLVKEGKVYERKPRIIKRNTKRYQTRHD